MKVGIMTFWWSEDNYGQLLQCYALQKYLREQGYDAYLIRYDPRRDYKSDKLRFLNILNIKVVFYKLCNLLNNPTTTERGFEVFRRNYITATGRIYYHYSELVEDPPVADIYITGSDQVWNYPDKYKRYENLINAYFLNFGSPDIKRISFAASFSRKKLGFKLREFIKPLLQKFDYVSVREKEGIELCENIGYKEAKLILDPTFFIALNQYPIADNSISDSKYIFVYLLGSKCIYPKKQIESFAAENGLSIKYVYSQGKNKKKNGINASIPEWLTLIQNADYIITNSFHGIVFSILFEKKFAALPLISFFEDTNIRLTTLLNLLNLERNYFSSDINTCFFVANNWIDIKKKIEYQKNITSIMDSLE